FAVRKTEQLDTGQGVGFPAGACDSERTKTGADDGIIAAIAFIYSGVGTRAAVERVIAGAAIQLIVAQTAVERVAIAAAEQLVVVIAAIERVAARIAIDFLIAVAGGQRDTEVERTDRANYRD